MNERFSEALVSRKTSARKTFMTAWLKEHGLYVGHDLLKFGLNFRSKLPVFLYGLVMVHCQGEFNC